MFTSYYNNFVSFEKDLGDHCGQPPEEMATAIDDDGLKSRLKEYTMPHNLKSAKHRIISGTSRKRIFIIFVTHNMTIITVVLMH